MRNPAIPFFAAVLASVITTHTIAITSPASGLVSYDRTQIVTVNVDPSVPGATEVSVYSGAELVGTGTVAGGVTTSALDVGAHSLTAVIVVGGESVTSPAVPITVVSSTITMASTGEFAPRVHLYTGQEDASILWTLADGTTSTEAAPTSATGGTHTLTVDPPTAIETLNFGYDGGDDGILYTPDTYLLSATSLSSVSNIRYGAPSLYRFLANGTADLNGTVDLSNLEELAVVEFFNSDVSEVPLANTPSLVRSCLENANVSDYDVSSALAIEDIRGRGQEIGSTPLVLTMPSNVSAIRHICVGNQDVAVQGLDAVISGAVELPSLRQLWLWAAGLTGTLAPHCTIESLSCEDNAFSGFDSTQITWDNNATCRLMRCPLTSLVLAGATTLDRAIGFDFEGCGMSRALVDYAIETLAGGTGEGGALNLTGNAVPSAARADDISALRGRGWNVTVET